MKKTHTANLQEKMQTTHGLTNVWDIREKNKMRKKIILRRHTMNILNFTRQLKQEIATGIITLRYYRTWFYYHIITKWIRLVLLLLLNYLVYSFFFLLFFSSIYQLERVTQSWIMCACIVHMFNIQVFSSIEIYLFLFVVLVTWIEYIICSKW